LTSLWNRVGLQETTQGRMCAWNRVVNRPEPLQAGFGAIAPLTKAWSQLDVSRLYGWSKENIMHLKTTLLAALGALIIATPAAVQGQPRNSHSYYRHHHREYHRGCHIGRRGEYGVFGHYKKRLTVVC
jgi:hypothetical protein